MSKSILSMHCLTNYQILVVLQQNNKYKKKFWEELIRLLSLHKSFI
jgi:hypothetical protein